MKRTTIKNRPIRTVEHGAGWHIDFSPADREYIAVANQTDADPEHVIGRASSKDEARDLIHDFMYAV